MEKDRQKIYESLQERIGRTRLEKYKGPVSNGNSIFIKRECDNPFGSHYDRVYLALFKEFEENRGLRPGMNVLENTSGSAGVSFAGIGRLLGYNCFVMIPEGNQLKRRREAIIEQGAEIILTPEEEYINGFPQRIPRYKSELRAVFLNHSMGHRGLNNEVTLTALEEIAKEVLSEIEVDIYVAGIGNGSSLVGPGRVFRNHNPLVQIIGYKPRQSGKSDLPGLINQDNLDPSIAIPFPHIAEAKKIMDKEVLVDNWNDNVINHDDLGRTCKAGISVALSLSNEFLGKNILVLGYDKANRY